MNLEKLKLIAGSLEVLLDELKKEINSDQPPAETPQDYGQVSLTDYDEVFYDGDE